MFRDNTKERKCGMQVTTLCFPLFFFFFLFFFFLGETLQQEKIFGV